MRIYDTAEQLIGGTPLIRLHRFCAEMGLEKAPILAKVEFFNPGGSVKDRAAHNMLKEAVADGRLPAGGTVIEPTSGNTGIGLAWQCALAGFRCIIVMPDSMSVERQKLMTAFGAELVLTPGAQGMGGAVAEAERIQKSTPGSIIAGQFVSPANPRAHYRTTGPEIWNDTEGNVDALICGIGTGGTITGTAKYLKEKMPSIVTVGVQPASSPLIGGGKAGSHKIQGIGANFIPEALDLSVVDTVRNVTDEDAYVATRLLAKTEGLLCGISSGAALSAAAAFCREQGNTCRNAVVVLPDGGDRYLSTDLF